MKEEDLINQILATIYRRVMSRAKILYDEVPGRGRISRSRQSVGICSWATRWDKGSISLHALRHRKIPRTGFTIMNSHANGFWGPRLKFAGFDAVVFEGKAPSPVYLYVSNGKAEIRDATLFGV